MLRFIFALFILKIRPTKHIRETVTEAYRVKPWDLDLNIHLNNAKYLKYLDKGRVEHIIHCKALRKMMQHNMRLIVANSEISYIKSLLPFQKFEVSSRITSWDQKYVYYEQKFFSNDKLYAIAVIRLALLEGDKTRSPQEVFKHILDGEDSPEVPMSVTLLNRLIQAQRIESSTEDKNNPQPTSEERILLSSKS
ncbi:MAG: acyl-CoA thioesterase [Pseudomonadales bacterium]|nr:acyl-CoA thioesterase [Pseudomonadales bacterium]